MRTTSRNTSMESRSSAGTHPVSKSAVAGTLQMAGAQTEVHAAAELQAMANNSTHVRQLKALQETANGSPQVKQLKALSDIANGQSSVTQLYPISGATGSFQSLKGRPGGHSNSGTKDAIIDEIFTRGAKNEYEVTLSQMLLADAKKALRGTWLSDNGCAICHKQPISDIEDKIVAYANAPSPLAAKGFTDWINAFFPDDPLGLKGEASSIVAKIIGGTATDSDVGNLISLIDRSPDNLYIGHSPTNSGIGANFDFNFDLSDPTNLALAPPSPRSKHLYDQDHLFSPSIGYAPSSPIREEDSSGDTWVKSSGASGWVNSDH